MSFYLIFLFLSRILLITSISIRRTNAIESKNSINIPTSSQSQQQQYLSSDGSVVGGVTSSNSGSSINSNHRYISTTVPRGEQNYQVPSPFISNTIRSLPAVKVDPKGTVYTTEILKQQLADELKLPLRDLRIVDPSFPNQIQATFTARPNVILFTLENIKVVIKHNEALVFNPFQKEVQEFVPALQQQISTVTATTTSTARFEQMVIEAALNVVCNNLYRRLRALSPAITAALNELRAESRGLDLIQTQVDELLPLKNKLDELRKRVKEIDRAIKAILDNDEDLEMMYLSGHTPAIADTYSFKDVSQSSAIYKSHGNERLYGTGIESTTGTSTVSNSNERNNNAAAAIATVAAEMISSDSVYVSEQYYDSDTKTINMQAQDKIDSTSSFYEKEQQDLATISLEMMFENYLNEIGWIASEIDEVDTHLKSPSLVYLIYIILSLFMISDIIADILGTMIIILLGARYDHQHRGECSAATGSLEESDS